MHASDRAESKHSLVCVVGENRLTANLFKEVVNVFHKMMAVVFNDCIGCSIEDVLRSFAVVALQVSGGLEVTDKFLAPLDVVFKRLRLFVGTSTSSDGAEVEPIASVNNFVRLIPLDEVEQGFGGIRVHHVPVVVGGYDELYLFFFFRHLVWY